MARRIIPVIDDTHTIARAGQTASSQGLLDASMTVLRAVESGELPVTGEGKISQTTFNAWLKRALFDQRPDLLPLADVAALLKRDYGITGIELRAAVVAGEFPTTRAAQQWFVSVQDATNWANRIRHETPIDAADGQDGDFAYYSLSDACSIAQCQGVKSYEVRAACARGEIEGAVPEGNSWRISEQGLDDWLESMGGEEEGIEEYDEDIVDAYGVPVSCYEELGLSASAGGGSDWGLVVMCVLAVAALWFAVSFAWYGVVVR